MLAHEIATGGRGSELPHAWHRARQPAPTWSEARQFAFDCATPLLPVSIPVASASGRTLTRDVAAGQDLPHYPSSAMDGWAVNGSGPWILSGPGRTLRPDQASTIATGGLVPLGAHSILRKESGQITRGPEGNLLLALNEKAKHGEPRPGQHIRHAGEEASAGEVLIPAGTMLNPAHIALAAMAGYDELQVQAQPVVAIVLTGSEVVTSGVPRPGQVRDTFGPQLGTVISLLGGTPGSPVRIGDSYDEWLAALGNPEALPGQQPDLTITTGGTGRSGTDHFRAAVAALGGRLLLDGVAMRPGHPAVLAELPDGRFVVGLPGNPLAAMMALSTLAEPLLAALGNRPLSPVGHVTSGADVDPDPGRTRLIPCRFLHGLAFPTSHSGPGMMRGLAWADGVMAVPPDGVQSGEPVPVLPLPWTQSHETIVSAKNGARSTAWHA
jgi:molybdopterin molybdotransferase